MESHVKSRIFGICFVLVFSLFFITVNAQNKFSVSGTVVDENMKPLYKANVSLTEGKKYGKNTVTGKDGSFCFGEIPQGSYILKISSVGFSTQDFTLDNISGNINVDSIIMHKESIGLQETVVTAKATRITSDRRIIYPTKELIETTADGVTLLGRMNLPQLSVIPGSTEVKYWGQGTMTYYINDAEATVEQVRAIQPKDIIRVEYIDRPGLEYSGGNNVALVLKFVVRKERGLSTNVSAGQYLNRKSGSAGMESRYNIGKSELALSYHAGYRNPEKSFDVLTTDETFNLETGTLYRRETGTGASVKWRGHDVALAYFHNNPGRDYFHAKAEFKFSETPQNNTSSRLVNAGVRNDTTFKTNTGNGRNKSLAAEIFYRHNINRRQILRIETSYYLTLTDRFTDYEELDDGMAINSIKTILDGKAQGLLGKILYMNSLSDKWKIQTYLQNDYRTTRNIYTGTSESRSDISVNLTTLSGRASYEAGKLSVGMGAYMDINNTDIEGYGTHVRIEPGFFLNGRFTFNNRNYAGITLNGYLTSPSVENLSTASQAIDEIQIRKGNPDLRKGHAISCNLNGGFGIGRFNFYGYALCEYNKNAIWEETFLYGNTVVRMPNNFDYIMAFKSCLEVSSNISRWLSGNVAVGYNRYLSKSAEYGSLYKYGNLWMRANVSVNWRRWILSYVVWTHNNDFYGEILGTSGRSMVFTLARTWLDGSLSTALSAYNPFVKKFSKQGTVNYSSIAPYSNWTRGDYGFRALSLNISYNFNFGRKSSNERIGTNVRTDTGIINSDKSGKVN